MKPTLLLATTDRWFPTARLGIAMAKAGFSVEAVCPSEHPLETASIIRRIYRYNGLAPLRSFVGAIIASKPNVIVPGDDLAARHLREIHQRDRSRKHSSSVGALIERSVGDPQGYPLVFARAGFMQLARAQAIRAPKTEVIASLDDLERWAADNGFPIVLKADGTSGGDGVKIANTLEEAERAFQKLARSPLLARALKRTLLDRDSTLLARSILRRRSIVNAQVFVTGSEATSAVACWRGSVLAALHFQVIQKTQSTGHATVMQLIENEEMSSAAEKMVRQLSLSGLHGFDFMLEANTANAHLIEINPRSTQVGHLTLGPGRDLPAALYTAVSGEPLNPVSVVTERDTIALFPQEWIRDAASPYLRSAYHDVPWEEPALTRACVLSRRKQSAWYAARSKAKKSTNQVVSGNQASSDS
ncbi:MAG: ATP-grasp domain-containing protein [Acidobacteriaceae bacterium]|nr:ATP-grasp domain-containing protein [Acidobacteriaceae bacterium]